MRNLLWISIFSFIFASNLANALPKGFSCSCPDQPVVPHSNCAPVPALLPGVVEELPRTSPIYGSCSSTHDLLNYGQKASLTSVIRKLDTESSNGMKSYEDVMEYASCYRDYFKGKGSPKTATDAFCEFRDRLAPTIMLASKVSGLPYAVEACLFKQESEFDRKVVSGAGAKGYAQFMNATVNAVNLDFFSDGTPAKQDPPVYKTVTTTVKTKHGKKTVSKRVLVPTLKKFNYEKFSDLVAELTRRQKAYKALQKAGAPKKQLADAMEVLKEIYPKWRARKIWEEYWKGTPNHPNFLTSMDAVSCPNTIFVASMMKQVSELLHSENYDPFDMKANTLPRIGKLNERDTAIAMAGAYNMGLQGFMRLCGHVQSLNECMENLHGKIHAETRGQLEFVRRCATAGNWEPGQGQIKLDCEAASCYR